MLEYVEHNNVTLAVILRQEYKIDPGINFFTKAEDDLQIGVMSREEGYEIKPHLHLNSERVVRSCMEALYVKSGKVLVTFFTENKVYIDERCIGQGDIILLMRGGHGFKMLEDTKIIEIKQGPYIEAKDKVRF